MVISNTSSLKGLELPGSYKKNKHTFIVSSLVVIIVALLLVILTSHMQFFSNEIILKHCNIVTWNLATAQGKHMKLEKVDATCKSPYTSSIYCLLCVCLFWVFLFLFSLLYKMKTVLRKLRIYLYCRMYLCIIGKSLAISLGIVKLQNQSMLNV